MSSPRIDPGPTLPTTPSHWAWLHRMSAFLPKRSDYAGLGRSWRTDLVAGITVAVVALPLALGFGVASGMGAAAGLITAVVAGIVAAVFGGSNFQVSGPTGAMTVVLVPVVAMHGLSAAVTVAVIAGVIVIAMGLAGMGRLVTLIPWPVIEGFTVGIAIIIALQQIPNAVGSTATPSDRTAVNALNAITHLSAAAIPAITVTSLAVLIMLVLPRIRRTLPASLIAVVVATAVVSITGLAAAKVGAVPSSLPAPHVPDLSPATVQALLGSAVAVAALAAIESLLSARVADGMADSPPSNPDRELLGQGMANVASGLFGGMPATGAIARTAVNVRSGAATRMAAIVHSIVLLAIIMVASTLVGLIPLAALAGVLIVTAYRMVELRTVRSLLHSTRPDRIVFLLTAVCTVAFDLVVAVEVGIVLAAVLALLALARASGTTQESLPDLSDHFDTRQEHELLARHIAVYRIDGSMFFGAAQRFLDELTAITDVRVVIIRMSGIGILDATGANALLNVVKDLNSRGITVIFKGLKPEHEQLLNTLGVLGDSGDHRHSYPSLDEAIAHAKAHVLASPTS